MWELRRLTHFGGSALMAVASCGEQDRYRSYVTMGAGRGAVGGASAGRVAWSPTGGGRADIAAILRANSRLKTGAIPGSLGARLHEHGLTTAVITTSSSAADPGAVSCPGVAALMDSTGSVDGGNVIAIKAGSGVSTAVVKPALVSALARYDVVFLDVTSPYSPTGPNVSGERAYWAHHADHIIGEALDALSDALGNGEWLLAVISPMSPGCREASAKSFGFVVLSENPHQGDGQPLYTNTTRWPGLVTPADLAPTLLAWWQVEAPNRGMEGQALSTRPGTTEALDRLDATLTDRYRLRVVVAKWYIGYGLLVLALGVAVGFTRPGRVRMAAGPALAVALIPAGLAVAALAPPGRDAVYMAVTGVVAAALAFVGTRSRKPERGLAAALLIAAALIASDTVSGSWLMRRSALEMGALEGLRFYGIGNEFMGCLVGMAVIGSAALAQFGPRGRQAAAVIGAAVVVVIGAPFWGANWGGAVTAAAGFASLWLLTRERLRLRHIGLAAAMVLAGALLPAALDLARPEPARSHIGASAAAVLVGRTGELGDVVVRKLVRSYGILRQAPWSPLAAILCAGVFWALLRRGGPGRRALEGKRWLTMGMWASLIAGLVAMVVNDSGVAAGFGCILAALGAAVFAAARQEEVAM